MKITYSKIISAPTPKVQAALDDFANVYKFHPAVGKSESTNGKASGIGAERVCHLYDGNKAYERLIDVQEGRWVVEVLSATMPIKSARATLTAEDAGPGRTVVGFDMEMRLKFPMSLMAPMAKMQFRGLGKSFVQGIEDHIRTGRLIEKDGRIGNATEPAGLSPAIA